MKNWALLLILPFYLLSTSCEDPNSKKIEQLNNDVELLQRQLEGLRSVTRSRFVTKKIRTSSVPPFIDSWIANWEEGKSKSFRRNPPFGSGSEGRKIPEELTISATAIQVLDQPNKFQLYVNVKETGSGMYRTIEHPSITHSSWTLGFVEGDITLTGSAEVPILAIYNDKIGSYTSEFKLESVNGTYEEPFSAAVLYFSFINNR